MNRDRIEGLWKQMGGVLKQRWGVLTFDQAVVAAAKREQCAGLALQRSGLAKEQSSNQIRYFLHRNRHWNPSTRRVSNAKPASLFWRISCVLKLHLKMEQTPRVPPKANTLLRLTHQPERLLQIVQASIGA